MPTDQLSTTPLIDQLTRPQGIVVGLGKINRHHYVPGSDRRENVAEHTLSIITLTWWFHQQVHSSTKLDTVLKYAVVHDFVEVYAGDVNLFGSIAERKAKIRREELALERFTTEFSGFPDMIDHMRRYQTGTDPEARFVWTADKIQALILGHMDNWRTYHEQQISLDVFNQKYAGILDKAWPELQPFFADFLNECRQTYVLE